VQLDNLGALFSKVYYVQQATHKVDGSGYRTRFKVRRRRYESGTVSAAPRETSVEDGGYVKGVGIAIVTQNKDPDGYGRVKVRFTWFDQPRRSVWARVALPMAGDDRGFAMIPEVGDEVAV